MEKLRSKNEFENLKKKICEERRTSDKIIITVGRATCGIASGANEIYDELNKIIKDHNYKNVLIETVGCLGECYNEPIVQVINQGKSTKYVQVTKEMIPNIIQELSAPGKNNESMNEHPGQLRIALENSGLINPEKIEDYMAMGGYEALAKALFVMTKDEIIDEVKASGLRGRGGAGFSTGLKWELTKKETATDKYIVCNADEGDPGAFMDRAILEGDPHRVIEAMIIAGYAIGANQGIIYIRAEYPLAVERLNIAIKQAKEYGFLGKNILGITFDFDISLSLGAGAFVCGEETSLLNSIEGLRGEPRSKPPFPSQSGLYGKPTNINNVETYANICPIIRKGARWFNAIGSEKSKGTKVFALSGKINKVGLIEVPMGMSLREIIYDIGGGIKDNKRFKAIQTGGPSGGCIPSSKIDTLITYESLQEIGSMMGSGGMIVIDEDDCMVDLAKYYLDFTVGESCGKCTPCRIGNLRLYEILERITNGQGQMEDIDNLKELGETIKATALCGLGGSSPNPVLSAITYFYDEFVAHIKNHKCPAGKCQNLLKFTIKDDKCIGCTSCARNCPVPCIEGKPKETHHIIQEKCIKCGTCFEICPVKAIIKE